MIFQRFFFPPKEMFPSDFANPFFNKGTHPFKRDRIFSYYIWWKSFIFGVLLDMQTQTKENHSSHTNLSVYKTTIGYKTHTDTSWAHVFFQHRTPNEVGSKEEQPRPTTNYFWVSFCCSSTGSSVPNLRIISCAESLSHKQSLLIIRNCRLDLLQQMSPKKNV